jgi:hypothetical protein
VVSHAAMPRPKKSAVGSIAALEAALVEARRERDEALLALATERELTNALRLQLRQPPIEVARYPAGTGLGPPPLRYELADKLNDSAKKALGPVHRAAKSLLGRKPQGAGRR